jgi:ribosomal protein S18 acetylase RimI-like enzyme
MHDIVSRPYNPDDFSACLSIFDSNVPTFFAPEERAEFCDFLNEINLTVTPYLVFTRNGLVVACGGLTIEAGARRVSLSWGMISRALHRQGLGTRLAQDRLVLARSLPGIGMMVLATSQHTYGFYEGLGFTVSKMTPDGFGAGLDRYDMELHLA